MEVTVFFLQHGQAFDRGRLLVFFTHTHPLSFPYMNKRCFHKKEFENEYEIYQDKICPLMGELTDLYLTGAI